MIDHGFDVIDVHHHVDTAHGISHSGFTAGDAGGDSDAGADRELTTRLAVLDARGVRGAVIIGGHTYLRPRGIADTASVNDAVAAYLTLRPDRFVAGVGIVEPLYGEAGHAEVERCRELGLVGVSFHNQMQGVPLDSPLMRPLIQKMGEAGLVPFLHVVGNAMENIWQVDELAGHFPDLPMIVLDTFHDAAQVKALPSIAERRPNLFFDLALSPGFEVLGLPQVRAVGAHRFLYGTDVYSWPLQTRPFGSLLPDMLESDLSDADKAAIFSGNVTRLLRLD